MGKRENKRKYFVEYTKNLKYPNIKVESVEFYQTWIVIFMRPTFTKWWWRRQSLRDKRGQDLRGATIRVGRIAKYYFDLKQTIHVNPETEFYERIKKSRLGGRPQLLKGTEIISPMKDL
jgi:hypothetical protein